ncbi:unnamed protein product [Cylindrotheca closterium]|uniref:CCHC-type domain-containing protein n=1 Tax=Cylindrotheca closterium TaxID=2856 RepID=A0AAD2PVI2_9STRA|nr:unnamed protein product [Cylindrotheca closterium]
MGRSSSGGGKGRVTPQKVKSNFSSTVVKHLFSTKDENDGKARSSYKDAKERVIDYIQASGMKCSEDMVKSIRDGKSIDFNAITPTLNTPTQTEAVARETEMTQNKILYSAKLDENMRRSAYFKTNKQTVKSNIMLKFVTKAMDTSFEKSADAEYDFLDFWEANQKFFAMKQGTTKNLMHFTERFLRQAEVLKDLYGGAWFRNFAVKTKAYAAVASTDTTARDKFKDDIFEAVFATGFLCNCDRTRTAPLMLDLQTNYCREVDYYPKTVSKAQDMLKIHMDVIKNPGMNLYQGKDQPNKGKGKGKGKPKDGKKKAACYVCCNKDHMSPKCPDRLLPKNQ